VLAEMLEVDSGGFLGNLPQALSHGLGQRGHHVHTGNR
jgi:hypothetical protein